MGRAIVRDPQVFLFDEPLSNLDASLRVNMRGEIKALHQRLGTTTIYVTHDQVEAMSMADRIVVLRDGRVEQIGAPMDLYYRPANIFVAGFIGSPAMNFLDGALTPDGFNIGQVTLAGITGPARQAVRLGIRPEDIRIDGAGVEAVVELVEPMGADTQITARLGKARLLVLSHTRVSLRPGEVVPLHLPPTATHLFDATTGLLLEPSP